MDKFICNVCIIEFTISERKYPYKRCINCHKEKEKERREKDWKQIEYNREKYKERAKLIKKEYIEKNKDKLNEYNKKYKQRKVLEEFTENELNEVNEKWILFNKKHTGRHITEGLSPKQKLKIMKCYEDPI